MRRDYAADAELADRVFALLETTFPGVSAARRGAERFGATWESVSTPFVHEQAGQVIGHVGLLPLPLVIGGRDVRAGGVHGVAVRADARRRGIFRSLMEELLGFAAGRYETLVLTTVHPEYFAPFGFRTVPESVFEIGTRPRRGPARARRLDLGVEPDRGLMHRLLERREPVSEVLGIGPEKAVWAFYEAGSDLRYDPELDFVIVAEREGPVLRLFDLVGRAVPPLGSVLDGLAAPVDRVVAYFSPDRLGVTAEARPHDLDGGPRSLEPGIRNAVLMVRGPFPAGPVPLMLPRPGRC